MNTVVIGAQFGDEGKGKIVDYLANENDLIIRYSGGLEDNKMWAEENIKTNRSFSVYDKYRGWTNTEDGKVMRDKIIKEYSSKYPSVEKLNQYFSMKPVDILKDLGE